jgi:hypothetical protein
MDVARLQEEIQVAEFFLSSFSNGVQSIQFILGRRKIMLRRKNGRNEKFGGICLFLLVIFLLTGWVQMGLSQEKYPTRAVNLIVPFTPGGSTDMAARAMGPFLTKKWGVPINVVNKPGGNTIPGTLEVYSAPPDGYTML